MKYLSTIFKNKYLLLAVVLMAVGFKAFSQQDLKHTKIIPPSLVPGTSDILIPDYSVTSLKAVRRSGIKVVELTWGKFRNAGPGERLEYARSALQHAKKAGILIWSTHLPFGKQYDISTPDEDLRKAVVKKQKAFIDLALLLHVKQMVIHPSYEPIAKDSREAHIAACRKSLKELAAYIKDKPIQLNIEDLPRTCLANTSKEILRILDGIPEIGVCFDANHLLHEKPEDFVRAVGYRIRMVHISDYDGVDEKHWMPGRGINDWNKIISALIETGYQGPFMYEVSRHKTDTLTFRDLKPNYDTLLKSYIQSGNID